MARSVGRPRKLIDWRVFDQLCYLQATLEVIADSFGCDQKTIETIVKREKGVNFSDYVKNKRSPGKIDLLTWQMKSARRGDVGMLIWKGKQHLGQSDKIENKNENIERVVVFDSTPDVE